MPDASDCTDNRNRYLDNSKFYEEVNFRALYCVDSWRILFLKLFKLKRSLKRRVLSNYVYFQTPGYLSFLAFGEVPE